MKFGAHMSISGGPWKAFERGQGAGCEIMQIFVKNNMQWLGRPYTQLEVAQFTRARESSPMQAVFGHAGYLINLAAPPSGNRDKSLQSLIQEIELATQLNLPFLVLHPGAHLGAGEDQGFEFIRQGLNEVFAATKNSAVRIALENTAGQGSCLGHKISHLARIYEQSSKPERLAVCLDTAHFFAAGYDIRSPEGWNGAIGEVETLVGLDQVLAFHLNDSKSPFASRVDRHAGIGQGHIGLEPFRRIVNDPRFKNLPGCLETPKSPDLHEDVENLAVLRSLVETPGKKTAPARPQPPVKGRVIKKEARIAKEKIRKKIQ